MGKLLKFFLLCVFLALSICACRQTTPTFYIGDITDETTTDDLSVPIVPTIVSPAELINYNVVVSHGEDQNCGGTVVSSQNGKILVLTAGHCIFEEDMTPMLYGYVHFNNDDKYRVTVLDYNRDQDLALLQSTDIVPEKAFASVASFDSVAGDKLWVIGFGAGEEDILSHGSVSIADTRSKHTPETRCLLIDASGFYGNSGGGVFNENLELIGVLIQIGPQYPAQGLWMYAVHTEEIREFLDPYLGVSDVGSTQSN